MGRVVSSILILAGILLGAAVLARAQSYSISWYTIDGGGGTSTGGVYSVSGTIGQPDAGKLTGGAYTVDGGFWAVQLPGSPFLKITLATTNAVISWPAPSTGFILQQNADVATTNWSTVGQSIVVSNGQNTVTLPAIGKLFFRLKQ